MNKHYIASTYMTSNEAGEEEVQIEYKKQNRTFLQWLFNIPKRENIKEVYVSSGTVWYAKGSNIRVSSSKQLEILDVIERLSEMSVYGIK